LSLGALLIVGLLTAGPPPAAACASPHPRALLGFLARPVTLAEMVGELERGCLALEDVRFVPGQDTIALLSPSQFALVARALGQAHGAFRIVVPPEAAPGFPPDTVQARRRGVQLRDELIHYGAASERLLVDLESPIHEPAVGPGAAVPMLVRVTEFSRP
jgi:hypothetical protein